MRIVTRTIGLAVAAMALAAGQAVAQDGASPLEQATLMATTARGAGEPAERAAADIASTLRLASDDVLRALRGGGYRAQEAAAAAAGALSMSVEEGLSVMLAIGYGRVESVRSFAGGRDALEPIVLALKGAGADARATLVDLSEAGVPRGEAVRYVSVIHALTASEMAAELFALGVSATEAAAALVEAGIPVPVAVAALSVAGYGAHAIASALGALGHATDAIASYLMAAGCNAAQVAAALAGGLGASPVSILAALLESMNAPEAMAALTDASFELRDVGAAALAAGVPDGEVAAYVLERAASLVESLVILRHLGWSASMAAQDASHLALVDGILVGLVQAGYHAGQAAAAVQATLGASPEQVAAGLRQAGLSASEAAAVLWDTYVTGVNMALATAIADAAKLGAIPADCFAAVRSAYDLTVRRTFDAFHGVAPLAAVFAWATSTGVAAEQVANWARSRGATAHEIAAALRDGVGASASTAGQALQGAGFTAIALCQALKDELGVQLFEFAGFLTWLAYSYTDLVIALMVAFNATELAVIQQLSS
jgi:hypothetical protein